MRTPRVGRMKKPGLQTPQDIENENVLNITHTTEKNNTIYVIIDGDLIRMHLLFIDGLRKWQVWSAIKEAYCGS